MAQDATLDTSFWINAHQAGILTFVLDRFQLSCVPQVAAEFEEQFPSGHEFWERVRSGEIAITAPSAMHLRDFNLGERAAISLVVHPRNRGGVDRLG